MDLSLAEINPSTNDHEWSDEALLRAYRSGDDSAFQVLFERYETPLLRYLTSITGSLDIGRDLYQETFLKLIDKPPMFLFGGRIKSWLYRVARNRALDYLRRDNHQRPLDSEDAGPGQEPCPSRTFEMDHDNTFIRALVHELPEDLRDVVCQRIYGELTFKEISRISRIPLGTALWRMQRAMKELKQKLEASGYEY